MPLKVLHLPESAGGTAWALAQSERALGLDSEVLYKKSNLYGYKADISLKLDELDRFYAQIWQLLKTFLNIRNKYDIYHFNFGSSLIEYKKYGINLLDLPFYSNNAKLFVTYNGCDARQKYATMERTSYSACHNADCYNRMCFNPKMDLMKKNRIAKMAKYVNKMFAISPDLLWFLPKGSVLLPTTFSGFHDIVPAKPVCQGKKITIMHAPTDRGCKGTDIIQEVMDRIKVKYKNVDFVLVEGLTHREALKLYEKADLVIDQLYVGWYGGLAVEVMKMGKPVVCYIREEDLVFIPKAMNEELPIINANKDNLFEVLSSCIENPAFLKEKAKQSLDYVNKWHDPLYLAGLVKEYYEG